MSVKRFSSSLFGALLAFAAIFVLALSAQAQTYKILHAFTGGADGGGVWDGVTFDVQGNIYGTTSGGGAYGYGTVFELSPNLDGSWTESVLHSFAPGASEGSIPTGGLVFDAAGNLYGTAPFGGAHDFGDVFEMTPSSGGWTESVIYSFGTNKNDGGRPYSGLVTDKLGNLYGTTPAGTVFELTQGQGGWAESILYTFCSKTNCTDGEEPFAGVVLDNNRNLYGATQAGGVFAGGTVYELRHSSSGWKESLPHSFGSFPKDGKDGALGELVFDSSGNLYGTTFAGGANLCLTGCGTVYKLTRTSSGHWQESVLYNFQNGATGNGPGAGVAVDGSGNLYGTTIYGGSACGCGVVYKLAPGSGGWTYTVLHTFVGTDGAEPDANLILHNGKVYGTASGGGAGGGVVFEVTP
jgi:uncharacterized repeat protein (TIGR03803 family)